MRAKEFISEINLGLGSMFASASKRLGTSTNLSRLAPKTVSAMGGANAPQSKMASVIKKAMTPNNINPAPAQKTTEPPQQNQQGIQVRNGDTIEVPNLGMAKVVKTQGTNVTLQPDPIDPKTTITTDKKKLGLR